MSPDGVAHLRAADPVLRALIDEIGVDGLGDPRAGRPHDHYGALVRSIVGQQLSTNAARSIYTRLTDRFRGRTPTPQKTKDAARKSRLAVLIVPKRSSSRPARGLF